MTATQFVGVDRHFCPIALPIPGPDAPLETVRQAFREQMKAAREEAFCRPDTDKCLCGGCVIERFAAAREVRAAAGLPVW